MRILTEVHSRRHVFQRTWRRLLRCLLVSAACCIVGCNTRGDDAQTQPAGAYSIRVVSPKAGQWTPGVENEVVLTLPEKSAKGHITLQLSTDFAGLHASRIQYYQLAPQAGMRRRCVVFVPRGAVRTVCRTMVDWEDQPMLTLFTPIDSSDPSAQLFAAIRATSDPDSTLRMAIDNPDLRISAVLHAVQLASQRSTYDNHFSSRLMKLVSTISDSRTRVFLQALITCQGTKPDWRALELALSDTRFTTSTLDNVLAFETLFSVFRFQHRFKERNEPMFSFVAFILGSYPETLFSQSADSRFAGKITLANYDSLVKYLCSRDKSIQGMAVLAKSTAVNDFSLYTSSGLKRAAEYVRFLADSIIERRRRAPGPSTYFELNLWRTRQVCAFYETSMLGTLDIDGSHVLQPVRHILPTFSRFEMRASGLAEQAGRTLDRRGDSALANCFYSFTARFFPTFKFPTVRLNMAFPPRVTTRQLDSMIALLETKGFIAPSERTDIPPDIVNIRRDPQLPTAVLFVASTCSACGPQKEILRRLRAEGLKFNIVVVFVGQWKEGQKDAYLKDTLLTCCMTEPSTFVEFLYVWSVPSCLVVDASGRLRNRFDGLVPYEPLRQSLLLATRPQ